MFGGLKDWQRPPYLLRSLRKPLHVRHLYRRCRHLPALINENPSLIYCASFATPDAKLLWGPNNWGGLVDWGAAVVRQARQADTVALIN